MPHLLATGARHHPSSWSQVPWRVAKTNPTSRRHSNLASRRNGLCESRALLRLNQTATQQPLSPLSPNRPPRPPRPAFIIIVAIIIIMFPSRLPASHCSHCLWYKDATALEPRHDLRLAYRCDGGDAPNPSGCPRTRSGPGCSPKALLPSSVVSNLRHRAQSGGERALRCGS